MTDENTCTVNGVEYVAVDAEQSLSCEKCAGSENSLCGELGFCEENHRKDKRNIDWVKKDEQ